MKIHVHSLNRDTEKNMSSATGCHVLKSFVWSLVFVTIRNIHGYSQNEVLHSLEHYEVIVPSRVTREGNHVTFDIHPGHSLRRRSVDSNEESVNDELHYQLQIEKKDYVIKITQNTKLVSPGFVIETLGNKFGNVTDSTFTKLSPEKQGCHYHGHVINGTNTKVAVGVCAGLHGFIHTDKDQYFIEPLHGEKLGPDGQHKHAIYRRSALAAELDPLRSAHVHKRSAEDDSCGVKEFVNAERRRERWEKHHRKKRKVTEHGRHKRSFSTERYVETMVVVDPSMVEYHKNEQMDNYILTIMNMVSAMFHDASIGNSINIVLVRILIVEEHRKDLVITHHADKTLTSFCKFQNMMNFKDDDHPNHHDVAVLLTRKNICSRLDEPCSTLGLAQVAGMCQPHWSCNINEDTGLALAYTVTHEIGHNFGMHHDTKRNGCKDPPGKQLFLMSPSLVADSLTKTWSNCSRDAITKFIDRDWGYCLNDQPAHHEFSFNFQPPGTMYDANHQCRLQYGIENITICSDLQDVCSNLWCGTHNRCSTHLEAAAEGTICAQNKWCYQGECVKIGERPESINGEWGEWTSWSDCTRTCGGGVSHSQRHCDNPKPSHGGKYCLGERKRYRICNTKDCPENIVSFHQAQCEEFNYILYKGHFYEWEHIQTAESPCQLHCKPKNRFFSSLLKDIVTDGTSCTPGTPNMCISGRCRHIGCDYVIDSKAKEDRCGVCHGDGSTCRTVKDQFKESKGLGYVEATVIPRGARNIYVEEMEEANNFLALQNDQGEYYLNGHWFIQWSGDYDIAGTVVQYTRVGNKESFKAPGPLKEPLHIMLLLQSENPGVSFEYTVPKENISEPRTPMFNWIYLHWTHCTASCGGGTQRSEVVCSEIEAGVVDDKYCTMEKPDDKQKVCNDHLCPARWWTGPWQHCSVTCGKEGTHQRTVICVRSMGLDEQIALDDEACDADEKPPEVEPCHKKEPCPGNSSWIVGDWSECGDNPCGMKHRDVTCENPKLGCDASIVPSSEIPCSNTQCGHWVAEHWSECPVTCGMGHQERSVGCEGSEYCDKNDKPLEKKVCILEPCPVVTTVKLTSVPPISSQSSKVLSEAISTKPYETSTNTVSATKPSIDQSPATTNEVKGTSVATKLTTVSLDLSDENIEIESFDIEEDKTAISLSSKEDESRVTEMPVNIIADIGKSEDYEPEEDNLFNQEPELSLNKELEEDQNKSNMNNAEENKPNDNYEKEGASSVLSRVKTTTNAPLTTDVFDIESVDIDEDSEENIYDDEKESLSDKVKGKISSSTDYGDGSVNKNTESQSSKENKDLTMDTGENDDRINIENHDEENKGPVATSNQERKANEANTTKEPTDSKENTDNRHLDNVNLPSQVSNLETIPRLPPVKPKIPELPELSDLPPLPKLEDLKPLSINTDFNNLDPKSLPGFADTPKSSPKLPDINDLPELPKMEEIAKGKVPIVPSFGILPDKDVDPLKEDDKGDKEFVNADENNKHESLRQSKDKDSHDIDHSSPSLDLTDIPSKQLPNLPTLPNKDDLIPLPDIKDLPPIQDMDELAKNNLHNLPKLPNKENLAPLPDIKDLPPLPNMEELPNKALLPPNVDIANVNEVPDDLQGKRIETRLRESNEGKIKEIGAEDKQSKELPVEINLQDIKNNNKDSLPQPDNNEESNSLNIKPVKTYIKSEIPDSSRKKNSDLNDYSDIKVHKNKVSDNQNSDTVLNGEENWKSSHEINQQNLPELKWRPSKWTECSRACGDGVRTRTVTCVDENEEEMDEILCDINTKPTAIEDCFIQECLEWQKSQWSECSASCGYSVRYRNVVCPQDGACDPRNQPIREELCSKPHCVKWMSGQWSRCSKKCGEGEQVRLVQCVNLTSQMSSRKCVMSEKPSERQACNTEPCKDNKAALIINCEHNEMSSVVCRALRKMGQCHRQFVKLKCCKTCNKDKRQKLNRERPRSRALR